MRDKRRYVPACVRFPETAATFKVVSASKVATIVPSAANQGHGDGDDLRRHEPRPQCDVPSAIEMSARETKDVSARPGRLLAPPFGLFLRAALLAHLERTFR
jgi:hypothetical protein